MSIDRELEELLSPDTPLNEETQAILPFVERGHDEMTCALAKAESFGKDKLKLRLLLVSAELALIRQEMREGLW